MPAASAAGDAHCHPPPVLKVGWDIHICALETILPRLARKAVGIETWSQRGFAGLVDVALAQKSASPNKRTEVH